MGKGRPRAVEQGVLGHISPTSSSPGALNIPQAPVFYPTEEEFKDPLEFIYKIRPQAEPYGICRIVPPKNWKPPFALDGESFSFPTKTQAIHQLQVRSAGCDPDTFELEYNRFLKDHCGKRLKKRVIFEGEELDLCQFFNAVKRYGGYDKVVQDKKWGEVSRFVHSVERISECSKHVLCQLYREHLYDYEIHHSQLSCDKPVRKHKRGMQGNRKTLQGSDVCSSKKRRKNSDGERVKAGRPEDNDAFDQICVQCNSGLHGEVMLLCDRCNKGWHTYCLSPPLKRVPLGNWYCLECVNSDKDSFGFVPGKRFSLEAFRRLADRSKKKWFGSACTSRLQIEKKFWEIVEGTVGEVEVMYGSDLDTSLYGSGFPRVNDPRPTSIPADIWDEYAASPWNLNNLPKLQGSMLRAVHHNIAGVMVPWLYVGMLFSSFCWHFEDHCFYSMNYLHWGEPKCWYSVPGGEADAFEQVMKNSLPDLFDAQPDLLFQLVTMLNPSVLQENGVSVYSVLQEPGNFVITFPRSFHGGFNFGLNCAEAVNFAPADWLPHGGLGAELYRLYHKAAVLSHEELVCVVAKNGCDSKVSPYLKKELLRIFSKEKTWRERLWRCGIVNSSPISPKKNPEFVGTEEDPTCIICQQYLYLSAVVCSCRPSTFVCLEHWGHLCECSPSKHCLLYRHTLSELNDLVHMMDGRNLQLTPRSRSPRRQFANSKESSAMRKKVKGGLATQAQLAEEWILSSYKILQTPFSSAAYINALKKAEQFLWGGPEMDPVRDMAMDLVEAQKWAEGVRDCLSKIEAWSGDSNSNMKVSLRDVEILLKVNPVPCIEPNHPKLKAYAEDAMILREEMEEALSIFSHISLAELELLYSRASVMPIHLEKSVKLADEISSVKVWSESVQKCISEKRPGAIEVDTLHNLKSEMFEFHVDLPERELLLDLLGRVEAWQSRCNEILEGPISLKEIEILLEESDGFPISIPELKLLRRYYCDALSWISHFHDVLVDIEERKDQKNVIVELSCILKAGKSLRVQVDELPLVEVELKKACCREKALQACSTRMSLDFVQQVVEEASLLKIENEKLVDDISGLLTAGISWEDRAKHVLRSLGQMTEFEEVLRMSMDIFIILPSLNEVQDALARARSWMMRSQPFLMSTCHTGHASCGLLKVDNLKELVAESKLLKVSLKEPEMLQRLFEQCKAWEHDVHSLLDCAEATFNMQAIDIEIMNGRLPEKIEGLVARIKTATTAGLSFGFDFDEIPKLQNAASALEWCLKVLSYCSCAPSLEEVEKLIGSVEHLPSVFSSSILEFSLLDGARWLRKALRVVPEPYRLERCKLNDAEEVLDDAQRIKIPFPVMVARLVNAIEKHKSWQEQVRAFLDSKSGEQSWPALLQLKELGEFDAFHCTELDLIASESEKIEKWILHCKDVFRSCLGDVNPLQRVLLEIKHSLHNSLYLYKKSKGCSISMGKLCVCCCSNSEEKELLACLTCNDWYHPSCLQFKLASANTAKEFLCPHCRLMENFVASKHGSQPSISSRKHVELKILIELLSDAKDFYVRVEERDTMEKLLEQYLACKAYLTEVVDFALSYVDQDLTIITERLLVAVKAVSVAGVYDHHSSCNLELALARNSWKVRVKRLLEGSQKPAIQQIHRLLKEGLAINILGEDHFMQRLREVKHIGMQWADHARKVASDSGELGLDEVFKLITDGENLPVHFEKELKLLRARSLLYCICRKPYDQRAMIACDQCDEWYHFDCINLHEPPPRTYICPACEPLTEELLPSQNERSSSSNDAEPRTPPPRHSGLKKRPNKVRSTLQQKMLLVTDLSNILRRSSEIDHLWWRNRKPLRRRARKRVVLERLSPV